MQELLRERSDHDDLLEKIEGTQLAWSDAWRTAMPDVGERLENVEHGLTTLGQRMDERFAQVDKRFAQVEHRLTRLEVLGEEATAQIKLIAEVQAHHGGVLGEIKQAMEPLKSLRPLFEQVASDHEKRITALEGDSPSLTDARSRE